MNQRLRCSDEPCVKASGTTYPRVRSCNRSSPIAEAVCRAALPKALYVVPSIDNPTTASLSEVRRSALISIARRHGVFIIEDDPYSTLQSQPARAIADLAPEARLAPPCGTFERVRLQEWLNFIATELHKGLSPLFGNLAPDAMKEAAKEKLAGRLAFVEASMSGQAYLLGDSFSVADGYLLYVLRAWQRAAHGSLTPALADYYARLLARPSVQAALAAEGLA